jgi:hypothetical protein
MTIGYLGVQGIKWPIDRVEITPAKGFYFHAQGPSHVTDLEGEIEIYAWDGTLVTRSWDTTIIPKGGHVELHWTMTRDQQQEIEREALKAQMRADQAAVAPTPAKSAWWRWH